MRKQCVILHAISFINPSPPLGSENSPKSPRVSRVGVSWLRGGAVIVSKPKAVVVDTARARNAP